MFIKGIFRLEPFRAHLALKLTKSANKGFLSVNAFKNAKIYAECKSVGKIAKKFTPNKL
jgi:hypothetical protein